MGFDFCKNKDVKMSSLHLFVLWFLWSKIMPECVCFFVLRGGLLGALKVWGRINLMGKLRGKKWWFWSLEFDCLIGGRFFAFFQNFVRFEIEE